MSCPRCGVCLACKATGLGAATDAQLSQCCDTFLPATKQACEGCPRAAVVIRRTGEPWDSTLRKRGGST